MFYKMLLLLVLLFTSTHACNFEKGQFYYVTTIDKDSEYTSCGDAGLSYLSKSTCTNVMTDNGRFSADRFSINQDRGWWGSQSIYGYQASGFDFSTSISGSETYDLKWSRDVVATHRTRFKYTSTYPGWYRDGGGLDHAPLEVCNMYNYSSGEYGGYCTPTPESSKDAWFSTRWRRPYGCSYRSDSGGYSESILTEGEFRLPPATTLWRSSGGNQCGRYPVDEIFPDDYGIFTDENYRTFSAGGIQDNSNEGRVDRTTEIIDNDVCICNRPGESEPKCVSDCPLESHPHPEMYYDRRFPPTKTTDDDGNEIYHPYSAFDDCKQSFCISGGYFHKGRSVEVKDVYGNHYRWDHEPPECIRYGCIDETAYNYNGWANTNDGSCIPEKIGCMMSVYDNYDPEANIHDVSLCGNMICSLVGEWALDNQCCV